MEQDLARVETPKETIFKVKNGEALETKPDVSLGNLFKETTEKTLSALEHHNIVIAAAPSGIGKTELFLGTMRPEVSAGGIGKALEQRGTKFMVVDMARTYMNPIRVRYSIEGSSSNAASDQLKKLEDSEIVLLDEARRLETNQETVRSIARLIEDGKKVVMVGGGGHPTAEQLDTMAGFMASSGVAIEESQKIAIKPTMLTPGQAVELLAAREKDKFKEERALALIEEYKRLDIPLMFRTVWMSPLPLSNREESVAEYLKNIHRKTMFSEHISHIEDPRTR